MSQTSNLLWYKTPAKEWTEALPIGNGRLGGMVHGRYDKELIQLNEESVWAGSPINNNNQQSAAHLGDIQDAIFKGAYKNAVFLANKYMVGTPPRVRSYQLLGNFWIEYATKSRPENYRRQLALDTGIASSEFFTAGGGKVNQEVYVSAPQDVMVIRISALKPIDAQLILNREKDVTGYSSKGRNAFYTGQIDDKEDSLAGPAGKHMRFASMMHVLSTDGQSLELQTGTSCGFRVTRFKNLVIILTGATDYNPEKLNFDSALDPLSICHRKIASVAKMQESSIRKMHLKDHQNYYNRVSFKLGTDEAAGSLPTDERLKQVKNGAFDPGLIALYYQYGRYLLMASSRKPGRLPANLQGIWNESYKAPWNSDFHTNINLQMNYWPAESGNLPETVEPLVSFIKRVSEPGGITAKEMYDAKGWTLHHLTDVFGRTGVADGVWGISPMAGPWMTFPLYEHFLYTQNLAFLHTEIYPLIKGSVEFVLDFLVISPEGYWVTNPSHSPENAFFVPGTGKRETSQLSYAATIDIEIVHGLFNNYLEAARILNLDAELVDKVEKARKLLPPLKVAANGTLQEWIQDYEEVEPGHRHMSHLLGLHPLNLISPTDSLLFGAAGKTLDRRLSNGGGQTGWSRAWIVNFYARLLDGDKAGEHLQALLQRSTLDNLFDTHPPFQIDGNFGGAAGIAEMLLQSQNNELHILPALPSAWANGTISGIRGRGGYTATIAWNKGILENLMVTADREGECQIRYLDKVKKIFMKKNIPQKVVF